MRLPIFVILCVAAYFSGGSLIAVAPPDVPPSQRVALSQAKELFEKGDYRAAEKAFERVLRAAPDNLYVLSHLGVVRFRAGKYTQAAEALQRAVVVAPDDAFSHYTLGIVQYARQLPNESVASLRRAIELNPKNAGAHYYLSLLYAARGLHSEAAREREIAGQLDPNYSTEGYVDPKKLPKEIPKKFRLNEA